MRILLKLSRVTYGDMLAFAACLMLGTPVSAGVSQDADGWTVFTPSADTRTIYVSSSDGRDTYDPTVVAQELVGTIEFPVATLQKAHGLATDGRPDWILLKRGDQWNQSDARPESWSNGGRSMDEPLRIGAYGEGPRPILNVEGHALKITRPNVAVTGIDFRSINGSSSPILSFGQANLLVEDTRSTGFNDGFNLQFLDTGIVRRNVVDQTFRQGIYAQDTKNLLIEENVFHANGTNAILDHGMYLLRGDHVTVRDNIVHDSGNFGISFGGEHTSATAENNLIIGASNGMNLSEVTDATVRNNVLLDLGGQGIGISIGGVQTGIIQNNVLLRTNGRNQAFRFGGSEERPIKNLTVDSNFTFDLNGEGVRFFTPYYEDITISNNTFFEPNGTSGHEMVFLLDGSGGSTYLPNELAFLANHYSTTFHPSRWFRVGDTSLSLAEWIQLVDEMNATTGDPNILHPDWLWADYLAAFGGIDPFIAGALEQSRQSWDPQFTAAMANDWFRRELTTPEPSALLLMGIGFLLFVRHPGRFR